METVTPKSTKNIYQRIIEVQKKVGTVFKNERVEMTTERSYKAVTHDDVAALLHLPLAEAGIVLLPDVIEFTTKEFEVEKKGYGDRPAYKQKQHRTDIKILVKWINADDPTDFIQSTGAAFAFDASDKGFAKAYSLALKIVLLKVHLLESRDAEEQRIEEERDPEPRKATPKPKSEKPPKIITAPPKPKKALKELTDKELSDWLGKMWQEKIITDATRYQKVVEAIKEAESRGHVIDKTDMPKLKEVELPKPDDFWNEAPQGIPMGKL